MASSGYYSGLCALSSAVISQGLLRGYAHLLITIRISTAANKKALGHLIRINQPPVSATRRQHLSQIYYAGKRVGWSLGACKLGARQLGARQLGAII